MLSIICNLKFCYKFLVEEDFGALSDSQFELFERSLEVAERLIVRHRQAIVMNSLSQPEEFSGSFGKTLDALETLSQMVGQFWDMNIDGDFLEKLDSLQNSSL